MTAPEQIKTVFESSVARSHGESVREKQSRFVFMISRLIIRAEELGYQLTFGDAFRDPRDHEHYGNKKSYGARWSLHKMRMAVDFNVFKNGALLKTGEQFADLGEYWESIGGSWGGRFNDGNHFSLSHDGRK